MPDLTVYSYAGCVASQPCTVLLCSHGSLAFRLRLLTLRTRTHSCLPSFYQAISINLRFGLYCRADVRPTLRAASATYPQSYSGPSSSTLVTAHTHRSSIEATAEAISQSYQTVGRGWYRTSAAGQCPSGHLHRDCKPAPSSHDHTQVQPVGTGSKAFVSVAGQRHARPPAIGRPS